MERLLERLARAIGRHPWRVIAAWALVVAIAAPFAAGAQGALSSGGFEVPGSQSDAVLSYLQEQRDAGALGFTLLVVGPDAASTRARLADAAALARAEHPELNLVAGPLAAPDGKAIVVSALAAVDQDAGLRIARELRASLEGERGGVRTYVLGTSAQYDALQRRIEADLARAETATLPVVALVLLLLFGAVVAAFLPLMLGAGAVIVALAIVHAVATTTEMSVFTATMVTMIGIGVAVDYSLFVLARFREELAEGAGVPDAVAIALATSGTAVVFSGITVVLSLLSIWAVPVRAVQSMAAGAMVVVAVAVIAAITLLPALLTVLGPRVDRGRLRLRRRRPAGPPRWEAWVRGVMARPLLSFCLGAGFLLLLAAPALDLRTANRALEQLPATSPVREGTDALAATLTGPGYGRDGSVTVLVRGPAARLDGAAAEVATTLARDPRIASTAVEPRGDALVVLGLLRISPDGREAVHGLVPDVRRALAPVGEQAGVRLDVGGIAAFNRDLDEEVGGDLWRVMALVVLLAYLVLLVLLRSVVLPLKAVLMNLVSIAASYGVLVAVFQWGVLDWTGYHALGHLNTLNPALILAITFGLSMDYEVFLLSRIRERYRLHGDSDRAVLEGIAASARLITSAAAIMVLVFGAFVFTGAPTIKEVGLGLAIAIGVDATVTRLVLVPSAMRLLGSRNWWLPGWLERTLPHVDGRPSEPRPPLV